MYTSCIIYIASTTGWIISKYLKLVWVNIYRLYWLKCRAVRLKFQNYSLGPRTATVRDQRHTRPSSVSYKLTMFVLHRPPTTHSSVFSLCNIFTAPTVVIITVRITSSWHERKPQFSIGVRNNYTYLCLFVWTVRAIKTFKKNVCHIKDNRTYSHVIPSYI
jgi:hypothetical protein